MPLLGRLDNKEHDDVKKIAHSPNGRRSSSVELDVTLPENVEFYQTSVQASMDVCDPLDAGQREGEFESLAQHESEEDLTNVNEEPCLGGSASLASEERHELSPMRAEGVRKDEVDPFFLFQLFRVLAQLNRKGHRRQPQRQHRQPQPNDLPTAGTIPTQVPNATAAAPQQLTCWQERWRGGAATQAATPRLDDDNGGNNGDNDGSDDGNDSSDDSNDSSDDSNNRNDNGNDGSDDGDDSDDATDGGGDAAKAGGDDDAAGFVVVFLQ
ncbi:hypothetical protein EDB84DRAFT_1571290 [Lactarius hengduanensis]|nr:hypothetical protein EDB84DRAFT_1571290 [Lactarius hengduanensis]